MLPLPLPLNTVQDVRKCLDAKAEKETREAKPDASEKRARTGGPFQQLLKYANRVPVAACTTAILIGLALRLLLRPLPPL